MSGLHPAQRFDRDAVIEMLKGAIRDAATDDTRRALMQFKPDEDYEVFDDDTLANAVLEWFGGPVK